MYHEVVDATYHNSRLSRPRVSMTYAWALEWVQVLSSVLYRSLRDWFPRIYYQLFIAEVKTHVAGQEYLLFRSDSTTA
jgi:hypothetical protein